VSRLFTSTVMLAACRAEDIEYYTERWPVETEVKIWVETHSDIPLQTIIDGCHAWWPEGVKCRLVGTSEEADIRYRMIERSCETIVVNYGGENVHDTAGVADQEKAEVRLHLDCFDGYPTRLDLEEVQSVVAHETGHLLGVEHVWEDCLTVDEQDPDTFTPHCGPAIMNFTTTWLLQETVADHEAFCYGKEYNSVVPFADRRDRCHPSDP
jgi:hypothetical protein